MTQVRLRQHFFAFLQNFKFTRNGGCMEIFLFLSVPVLTEVWTKMLFLQNSHFSEKLFDLQKRN